MKSTTSWTLHWDTCFDEREPEILGDPEGSGLGGSEGRFFTKGAAFGIFFALGRAIFRTGRDFAGWPAGLPAG